MEHIDTEKIICERYEDQINLFIDGELHVGLQAEMFGHLAACTSCRTYLEGMIVLRRMIADETLAVPPAVDDAFLQRLGSHHRAVARAQKRAERRARAREIVPKVGRGLVAGLLIAFFVGNLVRAGLSDSAFGGQVFGEEELVNFSIPQEDPNRVSSAVYVFYPGLTIEADHVVEPAAESF